MKKLTSLIFSLFICTMIYSQTIDKLDEKKGFKDFILGDSYEKWQSQLKFEGASDDGSRAYVYIGSCCNKVFNYPVDRIVLRFNNSELVAIYITTMRFQKEYEYSGKYTEWRTVDFENIKSSFSSLFGPPTHVDAPNDRYIWLGKKVMLISKYENLGVKEGDRQQITVVNISYLNKNVNNGF
jgi:hypothetical protein